MTLVYSSPGRLRAQGILRNLSNMIGFCFLENPVALVFSELEAYSEPCQIFIWKILFTALSDPRIFRTVAYSESKACSEYCQTSMTKYFIQNLV